MEHFRIILLLILLCQNLLSQSEVDNYGNTVKFCGTTQIQYALHGAFEEGKKTVFFVGGSLPTSRYLKYNDTVYFTASQEILKLAFEYNLVVLGKPNIPILLDYKYVTKDHIYRDSTGSTPVEFLLNDNMAFYVESYNEIINQVSEEFELSDLYIFGHSQGSRIAANVALRNDKIKGVILSSVDPLGRIATMIDKNYANFEKKDKTEFLQSVVSDGSNSTDSTFMNSTYYSWQSFSYPLIITMSKIEIPILMVYGTRDVNCPNCYVYGYLDTYNPNFYSLSYEGYNHNFFDDKGVKHWGEVIKDITSWINSK
jgi:pimeloyl-ACP methyl ester carboxylesterase